MCESRRNTALVFFSTSSYIKGFMFSETGRMNLSFTEMGRHGEEQVSHTLKLY